MRIALWGSEGRMGHAIEEVVDEAGPEVAVTMRVDRDMPVDVTARADVVVDFSSPASAGDALAWALDHGIPFVSGTTGLADDTAAALDRAAGRIAVLHAPNMSLGVAVARALVRRAAAALPATFQPEITEVHHARKADAPSGTALALAADVESARPELERVFGRDGQVGARRPSELGIHALRGGDVVGEHTVYFFGPGERVEVTHRATDRRIFARGAVAAATWITGRPAGRYTIEDVIGL